jgi:hypothetical protein
MVHDAVEMFRRLNVNSNVPAAPWLPSTDADSAPAPHTVVDAPGVDVVVEDVVVVDDASVSVVELVP